MSEESDAQELRLRMLRDENETLRAELVGLRGAGEGVAGKKIVFFFLGMLGLAFATALFLWTMAKRTAHARQDAERAVVPTLSRIDATGHSLTHAIAECSALTPGAADQSITLRVKLAPTGQLALLDSKLSSTDEELIQCVRRAPTLVHVAEGDSGSVDVEVRYVTSTDPDGTHVLRTSWVVRPAGTL